MTSPPTPPGIEMSARAARSFLASRHTGVLALAAGNRGYGFPVSYTYDEADDRFVFGFVPSPETKKREYADATDEATFTVYTYEDVDSWTSVIATGPIRRIEEDDVNHRVPNLFFRTGDGENPTDGRIVDLDQFERTWFDLYIETVSGRQSDR